MNPKIVLNSDNTSVEIYISKYDLKLDILKIEEDLSITVDNYSTNVKIDRSMLDEFILKYGYILCEKYKAYGFMFINLKDFKINEIPIDYTNLDCTNITLSNLDIKNSKFIKIVYMNNVAINDFLIKSSDLSTDIVNVCDLDNNIYSTRSIVKDFFNSFTDYKPIRLINNFRNIVFNDISEIIFYIDVNSIYNNKDSILKSPGYKDYISNNNIVNFYKLKPKDIKKILNYPEFNVVYVEFIPSVQNLELSSYFSFEANMKEFSINNIENMKKNLFSKQVRFYKSILIRKNDKGKPLNLKIKSYSFDSKPFLGFYLLFGYKKSGVK